MDSVIQELLDKQAISEVMFRYCKAVDRCDEEMLRSIYHDDAFEDHGSYRAPAHEFAHNLIARKLVETEFTMHSVVNHLIELQGDVAISEATALSVQKIVGDDYLQFHGGRYFDRFERRDGEWRVAYRIGIHDWFYSGISGPWRLGSLHLNEFTQGARGADDVSIGARERLLTAGKA
jgi:hypothetical protein